MSYLEHYKVSYPTDQVSPACMRTEVEHAFTSRKGLHSLVDGCSLLEAMLCETMLSEKAFARISGRLDPYPRDDRQSLIGRLDGQYAILGISAGPHATEQLVRQFEADVARQARMARF